jgi:translation initiation factor 2 beta subunit (eIF-2beta)/eIF-5
MTYCHVSAQIAQHAHDCDEIRCSECDSEEVEVKRNKRYWSKNCLDCGFYEDNEDF